ncbi:hypothetical protein JYU29_16800 [Tianweitania sp. BSSL-BM11]|uniref:Uncharacterized protein n=1 Tax=Tianweitania aestuarii TaxID=2814886 RepID=A0ABS5RZ74_9HYPH|nr:hypothetical protein [Tianweitania aestuarii]MBS9722355.1 hypothetical protein [Tianweitania aestuarii]
MGSVEACTYSVFSKRVLIPAMTMSETDDYDGPTSSALGSAEWIVCPEADFFNRLCPVPIDRSAQIRGLSHDQTVRIRKAFRSGYNTLQQRWRSKAFFAAKELTKGENVVWQAISLKTLRFNKFFEKIPRRLFVEGQRNSQGDLYEDLCGDALLPETGLDDSGLSKALRRLMARGDWIERFESDRHPLYGTSTVYSVVMLNEIVDVMSGEAAGLLGNNSILTSSVIEQISNQAERLRQRARVSG